MIPVLNKLFVAIFSLIIFLSCNNPIKDSNVLIQTNGLDEKYNLSKIKLPKGYNISVYAEVPNARSMCWGSPGILFIGNRNDDKVYAVVDENLDEVADKIYIIASNLNMPNGVAYKDGNLYVAEVNRILRFDNIENNLSKPPKPKVVFNKLPNKTHHGWKFISIGPDDKLYIPIGAPCNVCEEKDSVFATISRIDLDGSNFEIYAKGVRNSVGFTWHPVTKEMWFTDNGRDMLGDDTPFCELNHAPKKGTHFGFPYCHQGDILDPEFGNGKNCINYESPALKIGPHVAPLGLRFYTGSSFDTLYKNQLFIALHGSWNRTNPIGYNVSVAFLNNNKVNDIKVFASGWLQDDGTVLGRPVDIEITSKGSLLVSDDYAGVIYKIYKQ